jgi:hypothetical protein
MEWTIANIDDLTENELIQLNDYTYYKLFSGLFIMSKVDLEDWKATKGFDDWVVADFPKGYISQGWLIQDLDHHYEEISDFIFDKDKNGKLLDKFHLILDNEHKTKTIEDVEEHITKKLNKWSEKEFKKYNNNSEELYNWLANEISIAVR